MAMFTQLHSTTLIGIDVRPCEIDVDVTGTGCAHATTRTTINPASATWASQYNVDCEAVREQEAVKRRLCIDAPGCDNVLVLCPNLGGSFFNVREGARGHLNRCRECRG